jgi:hypothetical protein
MTNQEILDYFSDQTVYLWTGTQEELHDAQVMANASYNTLSTDYKIYFVSQSPVNDSRATAVTA